MTTIAAPTRPAVRLGAPVGTVTPEQVRGFVHEQLAATDVDGRSVLVLVPDDTRTCPLPLLWSAVH